MEQDLSSNSSEIPDCIMTRMGRGFSGSDPCKGKADFFIRKKHDGRLCPLCAPCKTAIVQAQSNISESTKKTVPGFADFQFEEVPFTPESLQEYKNQPPSKNSSK